MSKAKKKGKIRIFSSALWPLLCFYLIDIVVQLISYGLIHLYKIITHNEAMFNYLIDLYSKSALIMTMIVSIIAFPIFFYMFNKDKKQVREMDNYDNKSVPFWKYIWIFLLAIPVVFAGNAFVKLLEIFIPGVFANSFAETGNQIYSSPIVFQIIEAVIIGPIVEELIFRGLMFNRFRRCMSVVAAAIVSSLLFGIYHMNFSQGVYAFIMGLLLAYVYVKYKNLIATILLHIISNGMGVLVTTVSKGYNNMTEVNTTSMTSGQICTLIGLVLVGVIIIFIVAAIINKSVNLKKNQA